MKDIAIENKKKPRSQTSNRLTLSPAAQSLGDRWLEQVNDYFKGMVTLKRNDLMNVIIECLDEKLTNEVLEKIKTEKLTNKQKAKWIYKQVMEAEDKGIEVDLSELVKTAQGASKRSKSHRKSKNKASENALKTSVQISENQSKNTSDSI